ncbi:6-carboxytetrahydropterin synthase [Caldithrix abyssi]|nr:6-carboxytetrahydropterin synthase [Caldithrix abyssi]
MSVRDHIFIAHSLKGELFGKARNLHGATYIIDAEFKCPKLDKYNIVIDIDRATSVLKEASSKLHFQNLDEHPNLQGEITTTEFLARYIFDLIHDLVKPFFQGYIKITLKESHLASASYEGEVA